MKRWINDRTLLGAALLVTALLAGAANFVLHDVRENVRILTSQHAMSTLATTIIKGEKTTTVTSVQSEGETFEAFLARHMNEVQAAYDAL